MGDIDFFLNTICVGGRSSSTPMAPDGSKIEAFNILTAIDQLTKELKEYRDNYEFLCDFAHPNCPGALMSYGRFDTKNNVFYFSNDAPYKKLDKPEGYGLIAISFSLMTFTLYYKEYEKIMLAFADICNKNV